VALIAALIIGMLYYNIRGYQWMVNSLILSNARIAMQYPELPREQKLANKLGFEYQFLHFVKQNTPDSAVILFPPDSVLFPEDGSTKFERKSESVRNKAWASYFLYPRKVVYEYERGENPLFRDIDYVTIVNDWGYQYLEYQMPQRQKYMVLPVQPPELSQ